jgi:L-ascorbate metabolism protein UlaG (beta-lactamase superfamily)
MNKIHKMDTALLLKAAIILIIIPMLSNCTSVPAQPAAIPTGTTVPIPTSTTESSEAVVPAGSPTLEYTPPDPAVLGITYVCNAGYVISKGGKKILVDALYQRNIRLCRSDLPELIENNQPPFDHVDLVLVTHNHPDHFNAQSVGQFLLNNPGAVLVAEKSAADMLLNNTATYGSLKDRIHSIKLDGEESTDLKFDGIDLGIFSAPGDVPNLGFLIKVGGKTLLHLGDNDFTLQTKTVLRSYQLSSKDIDIAFISYLFLISPTYRDDMVEIVGAKTYFPMHYAEENGFEDVMNSIRIITPGDFLFEQSLQTWTQAK